MAEASSVSVAAGMPASEAWPKDETPDQSETSSAVQPAKSAAGRDALVATAAAVRLSHPANAPSPAVAD